MGELTSLTAGQADEVEAVLQVVRDEGGRITQARRLVIKALLATSTHLTAEELAAAVHAESPDVHLSTIYRNLEDLERLGVVAHAHLGHGPAVYSLASDPHCHLVCQVCGSITDVPDELLEGLATAADQRFGFSIDAKHFAVLGTCADCAR